jgi:hypothetical protein
MDPQNGSGLGDLQASKQPGKLLKARSSVEVHRPDASNTSARRSKNLPFLRTWDVGHGFFIEIKN